MGIHDFELQLDGKLIVGGLEVSKTRRLTNRRSLALVVMTDPLLAEPELPAAAAVPWSAAVRSRPEYSCV
jgi:hypothetical protein